MKILPLYLYICILKGEKITMEAFKNSDRIIVSVKVNNRKVTEFQTRLNEALVNPSAVIGCFNNIPSCREPMVEDLVNRMQKVLGMQTMKELLYNRNIEEILDDAQALADGVLIENEIAKMRELLPLVERIHDPSENVISKAFADRYKPYKTYDQLLGTIFTNTFFDLGIMNFSAKRMN